MAAQASISAVQLGLPAVAPQIRSEYGLSIAETGLIGLAAMVVLILSTASAAERRIRGGGDEHEVFTRANTAYRERFGFPFVICVREHDKESILATARARLENDTGTEVEVALGEIAKIARLRLEDLPR